MTITICLFKNFIYRNHNITKHGLSCIWIKIIVIFFI